MLTAPTPATTSENAASGIEVPPGILLFEDPPLHDLHRRLLSRVFTPRRMSAVEGQVREFCCRALDPLRDLDGFDFVTQLGAVLAMRTIGYLLGIPESDQQVIRDGTDERITVGSDGSTGDISATINASVTPTANPAIYYPVERRAISAGLRARF